MRTSWAIGNVSKIETKVIREHKNLANAFTAKVRIAKIQNKMQTETSWEGHRKIDPRYHASRNFHHPLGK